MAIPSASSGHASGCHIVYHLLVCKPRWHLNSEQYIRISNNRLSRKISYILRHAPWEYELEPDQEGWVALEHLLEGLRREPEFAQVSRTDIDRMIANSSKVRHQLEGDRIRAIYGHSIPGKVSRQAAAPPAELFHGTIGKYVQAIKAEGLRPMSRQYVHLSCVPEVAQTVAKRKGEDVVILKIKAAAACKSGIKFYQGDERVWLADLIPATWIEFPDNVL